MTWATLWRAFPSPLIYPQSNCLRSAKRQRWRVGHDHGPLTLVEFRPLPTPRQTLLRPLVLSADSPALLPGGTPPPLLHPWPCFVFLHTLTTSPHPVLPYFIFCLLPLESKVHDGKDFFFFFNLLVHPHQLEQSRALSTHSDHICLMNEFFVENKSLKISHFPEREVIRIYPSLHASKPDFEAQTFFPVFTLQIKKTLLIGSERKEAVPGGRALQMTL